MSVVNNVTATTAEKPYSLGGSRVLSIIVSNSMVRVRVGKSIGGSADYEDYRDLPPGGYEIPFPRGFDIAALTAKVATAPLPQVTMWGTP